MNYFQEKRLEWIGARRAPLNRLDLQEKFRIGPAQASHDIQLFLKLYPNVWKYNLSKKRYERVSN